LIVGDLHIEVTLVNPMLTGSRGKESYSRYARLALIKLYR
jgi:hypothetical protein